MRGAFSSSDHAALIVDIETAKSRQATEHEERIDPKVYSDPAIRREVQQAWKREIEQGKLDQQDAGERLYRAKCAARDICMEATRIRRKKHTSKANMYRAVLDDVHKRTAEEGPSPERSAKAAALEDRIAKEDAKAKKPSMNS